VIIIGIDNGVTGQIGIIAPHEVALYHTPVMKLLHYTKEKKYFTRIDTPTLEDILRKVLTTTGEQAFILLERPMVNNNRLIASFSALRAYEATLIVIERLKIGHRVIDSKEWQKKILPAGLKGPAELKKASLEVGKRTFPQVDFKGFEDADGLLLAEYGRRFGGAQWTEKEK
jgi:hypothetical protein